MNNKHNNNNNTNNNRLCLPSAILHVSAFVVLVVQVCSNCVDYFRDICSIHDAVHKVVVDPDMIIDKLIYVRCQCYTHCDYSC